MDAGAVTTLVIFVLFWIVFGFVMFWVYGLTPILHRLIKSNGDTGKAIILEKKNAGWGWYTGRLGQSLVFQPVRLKLEVHPSSGPSYIAHDRFNATPHDFYEVLRPGVELQVSIARFNPHWVASWTETAVQPREEKIAPQARYASEPNVQAGAAVPKGANTGLIVGAIVVVGLLCSCLGVAGGFAYTKFVAGKAAPTSVSQLPTAAPLSAAPTSQPAAPTTANTIPTGGLGNEATRAAAWGSTIGAIVQANPTSCLSPDGGKTAIVVTRKPDKSGDWQERWTVACDGASSIPVLIAFSPASGGLYTEKVTVSK